MFCTKANVKINQIIMSYNRNKQSISRNKDEKPARMVYLKALRLHNPAWKIAATSFVIFDSVIKVFHSYN